MARGFGGRRHRGSATVRLGLERLEGRTLLNASIDIAADGSLLYKTDPAAAQTLLVSRAGNVYTFAVGAADNPIDVTNNAAALPTTGSGGRTVTVTGPGSILRGRGLRADLDAQRVELLAEVTGRYEPPPAQ